MKGIKHIFLRECKASKVKIKIGPRWQCRWEELEVPEQKTEMDLFFGFHELGHYRLHKNDKRNYDDLLQRIVIEIEADEWANDKMKEYGFKSFLNMNTLALIALYLYEGNQLYSYDIEIQDRFIILYRTIDGNRYEIFSQFVSNLPIHPVIY